MLYWATAISYNLHNWIEIKGKEKKSGIFTCDVIAKIWKNSGVNESCDFIPMWYFSGMFWNRFGYSTWDCRICLRNNFYNCVSCYHYFDPIRILSCVETWFTILGTRITHVLTKEYVIYGIYLCVLLRQVLFEIGFYKNHCSVLVIVQWLGSTKILHGIKDFYFWFWYNTKQVKGAWKFGLAVSFTIVL